MQELGGSTARQLAKLASGNIQYHRHYAQFMYRSSPAGRNLSFSLVSGSLNPLLARSSNFFQAVNRSLDGEKNCIAHSFHSYHCYYHYYF